MKIFYELDLDSFDFWGGAIRTFNIISDLDLVDECEALLDEIMPDGCSETELNDLFWFEPESIFEGLGLEVDEDGEPILSSKKAKKIAKKIVASDIDVILETYPLEGYENIVENWTDEQPEAFAALIDNYHLDVDKAVDAINNVKYWSYGGIDALIEELKANAEIEDVMPYAENQEDLEYYLDNNIDVDLSYDDAFGIDWDEVADDFLDRNNVVVGFNDTIFEFFPSVVK